MDRAIIERHLAQAVAHVAVGDRNLARQRELVARLKRDGHDLVQARKLLANFEQLHAKNLADLERLQRELAAITGE